MASVDVLMVGASGRSARPWERSSRSGGLAARERGPLLPGRSMVREGWPVA